MQLCCGAGGWGSEIYVVDYLCSSAVAPGAGGWNFILIIYAALLWRRGLGILNFVDWGYI
jgi:hypothetical protein